VANADVGLWLLFDRALRLQAVYEPWTAGRRRRWRAALEQARGRVFEDLLPDGGLPLVHGGTDPDASGLLLVVLGLLSRRDPKAHRLVDATIDALGVGDPVVALRRYPPTVDVGFEGVEPAFVPASWWAVSALARLDRAEQAHGMADRLCQATPGLQPEMLDPLGAGGLGNTPLVWSHAECARALYLLRVADLRARWGGPAAGLWETARAGRQAARRLRSMSGRTEVAQNSRNPA
jgi:GH15 family glucan-1,4-alpha-glucosidase